jgi:hypothetical protein
LSLTHGYQSRHWCRQAHLTSKRRGPAVWAATSRVKRAYSCK